MNTRRNAYGYYRVTLQKSDGTMLVQSNTERAFIVTQLQYLLSPRLILGEIPAYRQLASCIDLLSFSIRNDTVELLLFSIDTSISSYFASQITEHLKQYQSELRPSALNAHNPHITVSLRALNGPHDALAASVAIHLRHEDWEYDRYSSIGFYLHDRRGDWMRIWRLSQLYENKPEQYLELIHNQLHRGLLTTRDASRYFVQ